MGCLDILNCVIQGTSVPNAVAFANTIIDVIIAKDIVSNENVQFLTRVAYVMSSILNKIEAAQTQDFPALKSFFILASLSSAQGSDKIEGYVPFKQQVELSLSILAKCSNVGSVPELFSLHFETLLNDLAPSCSSLPALRLWAGPPHW